MTPAEFEAEMLQYFKPEFLVTNGLFERAGEDVQLVASINRDAALLVEIDKSAHTIVFTSDDETLLPTGHTALQCGLQRKPEASAEPATNLWVVSTVEDVEILKQLKLPAVLSHGLETLRKQEIESLFVGNHRTDADWQYDSILVDFDFTNLVNRPAVAIGEVTKRLVTAATLYAIDPSRRFTVLRPTTNEFELLEQATAFGDSDRVRELLQTWATAAKQARFNSGFNYDRREVPSFSAARQNLERLLKSKCPLPSSVAEALEAYHAAGRDPVIQEFLQEFELATESFTKTKFKVAAYLAHCCFEVDPLAQEAEAVLGDQTRPSGRNRFDEEQFARLLRCMSELRKIEKDLKGKR